MSFHKKNIHPSYPTQLSQTYQPFRPMTVGLGRLDELSIFIVKMCCHNCTHFVNPGLEHTFVFFSKIFS